MTKTITQLREVYLNEITKWHFDLSIGRDVMRMERGWKIFNFSLFRWKQLPEQGERIQSKHYRGILIQFAFFFPIEKV